MLPIVLFGLSSAAVATFPPNSPVCAVGRAALADLMRIDKFSTGRNYYGVGAANPSRPDLMAVCPSLKSALPKGLSLASADILQKVKDISSPSPVTIFGITAPQIEPDGKHATVLMGHYCNGLCGAWYTVSYALTSNGWKQDGPVPPPAIS